MTDHPRIAWSSDTAQGQGWSNWPVTDTGLRLSRYFGMSEGFWTGLQDHYERELTKDRLGDALEAIDPIAS